MSIRKSILNSFPPMGIYEVLFSFLDATGTYMGEPGTNPWAQGFPLTTQLPGGPKIPLSVSFSSPDLKYPPATGDPVLLEAIRDYYNEFYGSNITTDNVAVFVGGRPAIFATVAFLAQDLDILIEETEYTPYFDLLNLLKRNYSIIPSNAENRFRPSIDDYRSAADNLDEGKNAFVIKSNPCNPTGVALNSQDLESLAEFCVSPTRGGIFDEAYEFFRKPEPESVMKFIRDINETNIFVIGAATKGLQVPGMRTGWAIASKKNIEIFRNFSSIAMGGVSRPSQIYVAQLLERQRVQQARVAVGEFYSSQRDRYRSGLENLGIELFTGDGGFYHWGRLPNGLSARELNTRLFKYNSAILPGTLCDMYRRGDAGPHSNFLRFSFGPLSADSFENDMAIMAKCI